MVTFKCHYKVQKNIVISFTHAQHGNLLISEQRASGTSAQNRQSACFWNIRDILYITPFSFKHTMEQKAQKPEKQPPHSWAASQCAEKQRELYRWSFPVQTSLLILHRPKYKAALEVQNTQDQMCGRTLWSSDSSYQRTRRKKRSTKTIHTTNIAVHAVKRFYRLWKRKNKRITSVLCG